MTVDELRAHVDERLRGRWCPGCGSRHFDLLAQAQAMVAAGCWDQATVGVFLRAAYGCGYQDGLTVPPDEGVVSEASARARELELLLP